MKNRKQTFYIAVALLAFLGIVRLGPVVLSIEWGWNLQQYGCFLVACASAAYGMEYYARYSHRYSWHSPQSMLYKIHQSHHRPRTHELFEENDALGIGNFFIVIGPLIWSFLTIPSYGSALLFGLCCGISMFGTAYMWVHDGVHHKRFPTLGVERIPWIRRVADAHKNHHTSKQGPPFGLFLGEEELEAERLGVDPPPMPLYLKISLLSSVSMAATALVGGW